MAGVRCRPSGSGNNRSGDEGSSRGVNASIGHGITRAMPLDDAGRFLFSASANQAGSTSFSTDSGTRQTLTHGAAAGLTHSTLFSTARLRFQLQDSRSFGEGDLLGTGDTVTQNGSLQGSADARFGRFSTLGGTISLGVTRQQTDLTSETFPFSSLSINYRNARLLGVRRLRFTSSLSLAASNLSFIGNAADAARDISFENRLDYSIGRVDMRATAAVTESNGRINSFVFFTLSRRFGGVFEPGR